VLVDARIDFEIVMLRNTRKFMLRLMCMRSFFKKKLNMPLQYYISWTKFRDELLPISRSVFDIGWKVEIVGNAGSTRGYLGEIYLFGQQRDEMGTSTH
jgi:hypothetical protein